MAIASSRTSPSKPPVSSRDLDEICSRTESLWNSLRGQRIFLTGGTGFFGAWLLESFIEANRRFSLDAYITVLTRSPESFRRRSPHLADHDAVALLEGDVRNFIYPDGDFAAVIHAATETGDARTSDRQDAARSTFSTIFDGTRHTLEFAASHGARNFLMTSSGAVYGVQPTDLERLLETWLGAPDIALLSSAYGEAKRAAEALCVAFHSDAMQCHIARCFAFVGPHLALDGSFAIGNFIQSALAGETIRVQGDGTPLRSYLYATDLAIALWTCLLRGPAPQPVNIGSDKPISIRELALLVADTLAPGLDIEVLGTPMPGQPPARYIPSVQRASELLGLEQTVDLGEAIQRTAEWYGWKRREG